MNINLNVIIDIDISLVIVMLIDNRNNFMGNPVYPLRLCEKIFTMGFLRKRMSWFFIQIYENMKIIPAF